jgi:hypothetical protein
MVCVLLSALPRNVLDSRATARSFPTRSAEHYTDSVSTWVVFKHLLKRLKATKDTIALRSVVSFVALEPVSLRLTRRSRKQRCDLGQHFIKQVLGKAINSAPTAIRNVKDTRLITAYKPSGFDPRNRHTKANSPRKLAAIRDRKNDRKVGGLVEWGWGDHQNGTMSLLLSPLRGVKRHHVNIAPVHQISLPTSGASIHSRSSPESGVS